MREFSFSPFYTRFFYSFLFIFLFHWIYLEYLVEVFGYANYLYYKRDFFEYFFVYLISLIPLFFYNAKKSAASFASSLIYVLMYAPGQLMLLFMWKYSMMEYYVVSFFLFVSMSIIFLSTHFFFNLKSKFMPSKNFELAIHVLSVIGLILILYSYGATMRLVGFDEVYDLRSEANQVSKGVIVDYTMIWLTFLSVPFYFSIFLIKKKYSFLFYGLGLSVLIYASQGAKIAILSELIVFSIYLIYRFKGEFLSKILFMSFVVFFVILFLIPDDGLWLWVKSILMVRIYSNAGWALVTYYEFFRDHGYTFYNHISPIKMIFDSYPYDHSSLGQLIGLEYVGNSEANFNANFWASDGFAAIGSIGLVFVSFFVSVFLVVFNYFSRSYDALFIYLFSVGFFMSMLNLPFSTALLSGGGLLLLLMLFLFQPKIVLSKK